MFPPFVAKDIFVNWLIGIELNCLFVALRQIASLKLDKSPTIKVFLTFPIKHSINFSPLPPRSWIKMLALPQPPHNCRSASFMPEWVLSTSQPKPNLLHYPELFSATRELYFDQTSHWHEGRHQAPLKQWFLNFPNRKYDHLGKRRVSQSIAESFIF